MEQPKDKYYNILEELMRCALRKVAPSLLPQDIQDISEYIEYQEYGAAWELMLHIIKENNLYMPNELIICGKKMGFSEELQKLGVMRN